MRNHHFAIGLLPPTHTPTLILATGAHLVFTPSVHALTIVIAAGSHLMVLAAPLGRSHVWAARLPLRLRCQVLLIYTSSFGVVSLHQLPRESAKEHI